MGNDIKNALRPAITFLILLTLITGILYPLAITGVAQAIFPHQANGSLVQDGDRVVGSELIGQNFAQARYFHPRPSAAGADGYDATSSSGSNLGPTSAALVERVKVSVEQLGGPGPVPVDLVTTSGSGLDPHISLASARAQIERVARARKIKTSEIEHLVEVLGEGASFLWGGTDRVNVLRLNLALDASVGGESTP